MTKLPADKLQWLTLAALFPLWGIGALQLLIQSAQELTGSDCAECALSTDLSVKISAFSFCVALAFLSTGIVATLRLILRYQEDRMPRVDLIRQALESEADYDSQPQAIAREVETLSYTSLWYMSFQNHLRGKSGYTTLKLSPLKQWPAILKNELGQDLVPVWNVPLLLISLISIPALAILIAALNVVVAGVTGVFFCQVSYQIVKDVAGYVTFLSLAFPVPVALLALAGLSCLVVPKLVLLSAHLKNLETEREFSQNGFSCASEEELMGAE